LAVISPDYSTFINRIKFLEILSGGSKSYSTSEILIEMEKAGVAMTPEEKEMAAKMKEIDTPELKKMIEEFQQKYGQQNRAFELKYAENLRILRKEAKGTIITPALIEEYLAKQNIEITADEKALLVVQREFQENPQVQKMTQIYTQQSQAMKDFHTTHKDFINELFQQNSATVRKENIKKVLGIQPGFATDIMTSQDRCRPIVAEMTPCTDEKLLAFQKEITTPFIANYIALKNREAKAKIASNKKQVGSNSNEVPKSAGDKVFDAIMEKYKGKVVYVDFWATWCAPCRSGIEQIQPLKEEMANENVAFVYITNETSPKTTYDNMIPTIKGEHYRVSPDDWNILCGMFKISGIPHYVLVDKDGKVINPELGHFDNTTLKATLMKYIKE
jgi:thiol-disulfide isomerase/thioredoxin